MLPPSPLVWSMRVARICQKPGLVGVARAWYASAKYPKPTLKSASSPPSGGTSKPRPKPDGTSAVVRSYKPRTPGTRHLKRPINDHLWKGRPFKPLTLPKKGQAKGGRNVSGQITVRHRGGGHKRRIRIVDFKRWTPGPHLVERIEHDPNRSAHIALLNEQATGKKSYIISPDGVRVGDILQSYRSGLPQELLESMGGVIDPGILAAKTAWRGNCLPLHMVPVGTIVFNVGSRGNGGAVFCRSAGTFAVVIAKEDSGKKAKSGGSSTSNTADTRSTSTTRKPRNTGSANSASSMDGASSMDDTSDPDVEEQNTSTFADRRPDRYVHVKLQSGEVRKVSKDACCTIGVASNIHYNKRQLGKAGRSRWLNIRPTVRGLAMNKVDHPHGGGRGKSKSNVIPTSPWGTPAKSGYKTRRKHNVNKWVVTPRPRNMGRRKQEKGKK